MVQQRTQIHRCCSDPMRLQKTQLQAYWWRMTAQARCWSLMHQTGSMSGERGGQVPGWLLQGVESAGTQVCKL